MGRWKRRTGGVWVKEDGIAQPGSESEKAYWQVRAALLDPLAYSFLSGSGASTTVDTGETWYTLEEWRREAAGSQIAFHREPDAINGNAVPYKAGETITLQTIGTGPHAYICKPADVIALDSRYDDDPRGLWFERVMRLETELTHYDLGHANTGSSVVTSSFPADFTNGMILHASSHDVAWTILHDNATTYGINLNSEVSDTDRIRFAQRVTVPFVRTAFPKVSSRGVSESEGMSNVRYVKLPGDW